jgi:hypothetical protein
MRQSVTYQKILREGYAKGLAKGYGKGQLAEARRQLLKFGTKTFRAPATEVKATIEALTDLERLEALVVGLVDEDVRSWDDLFERSWAGPDAPPRES